jgi:hypothetical protein
MDAPYIAQISHLSFHQFQPAVGSFPRQVLVQQLPPPTYPAGLTCTTTFPSYPTTTSVANQPGVLEHNPAPAAQSISPIRFECLCSFKQERDMMCQLCRRFVLGRVENVS